MRQQPADPQSPLSGLRTWLVEDALPFWSRAGFDADRGRFRERLDWSARPLDVPHRAMVQARQISVYAQATRFDWFPEGAEVALKAMACLQRDFCVRSGGQASFAYSIDAGGRVASPLRDAYAHAFILFAIAHTHQLTHDPRLLDLATEVTAFVDARLTDPHHGGMFDSYPVEDEAKRQNPLMHLLEAYLALEETAPGRGYIDRAGSIVNLLKRRLFDPRTRSLPEYFARDWSEHPQPARRCVVEPGHHFEWVWLLHRYQAVTGEDLGAWSAALFDTAVNHGVAPGGLVVDEIARDGSVRKASHRVWPQAEALKAAVVRHAAGDPQAQSVARRVAAALMDGFLDRPFPGGWVDHIDAGGAPLVDFVPASTLYHLVLAAAEIAQSSIDTGG